jgi:hypothetical protein
MQTAGKRRSRNGLAPAVRSRIMRLFSSRGTDRERCDARPFAQPRGEARVLAAAMLVAALGASSAAIAGCGSTASRSTGSIASRSTGSTVRMATTTAAVSNAPTPTPVSLTAAEHPRGAQFPRAHRRSLQQLGKLARSAVSLGAATGSFTPGDRRFAFALTQPSGGFLYEPTAIYIAASPSAPARGPFLAPADPMGVAPQYRSRENAGPNGIQAIYDTDLPLPHAGTFAVLSLTLTPHGYVGAPGEIAVAGSSAIPNVGQRPPAIATDTASTVHGDTALLTTRLPPEHMASVSFEQVLGKRPIALLFSTPALCVSRVCGPVTDIAVSLQHRFGNRITFIHEEVYVDNQPSRGLRPQLKAFHLQTEPWLFTINRRGIIAARLEGAYGTAEMTRALQAALR